MNEQLKPLLAALAGSAENTNKDIDEAMRVGWNYLAQTYPIFNPERKFQLAALLGGNDSIRNMLLTTEQKQQLVSLLASAYEAYTLRTKKSSAISNVVSVISNAQPVNDGERLPPGGWTFMDNIAVIDPPEITPAEF